VCFKKGILFNSKNRIRFKAIIPKAIGVMSDDYHRRRIQRENEIAYLGLIETMRFWVDKLALKQFSIFALRSCFVGSLCSVLPYNLLHMEYRKALGENVSWKEYLWRIAAGIVLFCGGLNTWYYTPEAIKENVFFTLDL